MKLFDRFNNTLVYNNVSHNLRPVADIIKGSKSAISAKSKLDAASSGKNVATELNTTEEVTKKATKDSSKSTTAKTANESEETTNDSKKEIASPAGAGESVKQSVVTPDVKSDNAATKSNVIGEATEKATKDSSKSTTAKTTSDTAEATKGKKSKGSDKKILKKYSNKMSVITKPLQSTLDTKKSTLSNLADLNLKDKKVNTVSNKKNTIAYTIPSGKKKISVKFLDSVCQKIVKANDKAVKDAKKKEANKNNDTTDETDDGTTDGTTDDTTTTELTADQQLLKKLQEDTSWTNIHTRDYDDRKVIVDIQYNPISKVEPHKPVDIGTKIYFRMIGSPNKADLANAITLNFDYSSCFKPISPSDIIIQDYVIAMASDQTYSSVKLYESTVAYVFPLEVYKAPINSRVCTSTIQISNGYSPIKLPINFFFKSSSDPSATSAKKIFDLEKGKDDYYEEIMALKDKHCELSCQAWLDHGSQVDKSTSYSEFITAVDAFKVFYATYAD